MNTRIAVTIQNFVQYYSLKPFLELKKYNIDIYVPNGDKYNLGVKQMHDDIYNFLKKNNYNVFRKSKRIKYQVLLEPYPMDIYLTFNYKYRIKYKYAAISAKPKYTYGIEENILYDAILCYSTYEEELLNVFYKTYIVGRLPYQNFKKENTNNKKKTILYLPTYGDFNSIDELASQLEKLSKKYRIIAKEHHGTNYLFSENNKSKKLQNIIANFYDSSYPLSKLLAISDVVITDNSGSIFEAIYAKTPVCIYSKDIKECNFNDLESYQYQLVKDGIIPYTNKKEEIETIINNALSKKIINKQTKQSKALFPINYSDSLKSFTNIIDLFIKEDSPLLKNRIILHSELRKYIQKKDESISLLNNENKVLEEKLQKANARKDELYKVKENQNNENNHLKNQITSLNNELNEYKNGKLYKISTKIYSFKSKLRRKK